MISKLTALIPLLAPPTQSGPGRPAPPEADGNAALPAALSWGDFDGDGRLDLAAVTESGALRVLRGQAGTRFEDVTERVGLSGVEAAGLAIWGDYDADGRLDLFVGALAGASRLLHNEGGSFLDMSAGSGLACTDPVRAAEWFDLDGDGRLDLFVSAGDRSLLFHAMEGGFFETSELPFGARPAPSTPEVAPGSVAAPAGSEGTEGPIADAESVGRAAPRIVVGSSGSGTASLVTPPHLPTACAVSIRDQANPGTCLQGSSTPVLGELYPLSNNLFVAVSGQVGIGTTSPAARLHVAGTARVTDTLTLAPSGDVALDVSSGSIYKGGALFIHTKGSFNTGMGLDALRYNTGANNTASGFYALRSNTTGSNNTASGRNALLYNTTGTKNTASGVDALRSNTEGGNNTAIGFYAMRTNTTGSHNTAIGANALLYSTTGSWNTANGVGALYSNTTGSFNTASGEAALFKNVSGTANVAVGMRALFESTAGRGATAVGYYALRQSTSSYCTATGFFALRDNTTGQFNTAHGANALKNNVSGQSNTAVGSGCLVNNTTGTGNTAVGEAALFGIGTGTGNVALGANAGRYSTGSDGIFIGHPGVVGDTNTLRIGQAQARAFIAGIRGRTTGVPNAIPVLIDSNGQLGTVSSSRRFKEDIRDMGDATRRLLELRPVLFRYKQEQTLPNDQEVPPEYGLIAEEVAEILPDLVVYDEEGKPFTVKYHMLSAMLLNELEKLSGRFEELRMDHESVEARVRALESAAGGH